MDDPSRTWPTKLQSFCESLLDCLVSLKMYVCLLFETIKFNSSQLDLVVASCISQLYVTPICHG